MINEPKKYINEGLRLRIRNPAKPLANVMKLLTDAQENSLKDMGFKQFLGFKAGRVPSLLARWILLNYNPITSVLHAGDVNINITSKTVNDIFGIPIGGEKIEELSQAKKTDGVIDEWRAQFFGSNESITSSSVAKKILENKDDAGRIFKLNFLVLFVTLMIESTTTGTVNQKFLTCLKNDTDYKKFDWCEYLLRCLKRTRKHWKGGSYNGPIIFLTVSIFFYDSIFNGNYIILCILYSVYIGLQVLYAQTLKPIVVKIPRSAIITRWTFRKLSLLEKDIVASQKDKKGTNITKPINKRMTKTKIQTYKPDTNEKNDPQVKEFLKILCMHKLILHF